MRQIDDGKDKKLSDLDRKRQGTADFNTQENNESETGDEDLRRKLLDTE